jgi:hypothetical protein
MEDFKLTEKIILIPRVLRLFNNRIVLSYLDDPKNDRRHHLNISFWATDSSKELFISLSSNKKPFIQYKNWKKLGEDYFD